MLCLTDSMAMLIGAAFTGETGVGIFGLAAAAACGLSLYDVFRTRESHGAAGGIILIVCSIISGFAPIGIMITTLLGNALSGSELMLYIFGGLSAIGLLAVGIMAVAARKRTYRYTLALPPVKSAGTKITGMVLAFIGGAANAIMGVAVFIQYFDDFKEMSYFYDISQILIIILLMILTLFAAFTSLKNRLVAGILLTASGGMLTILMLITTLAGLGSGEAIGFVIVLAELLVTASGVLCLVSYKRDYRQFELSARRQAYAAPAVQV